MIERCVCLPCLVLWASCGQRTGASAAPGQTRVSVPVGPCCRGLVSPLKAITSLSSVPDQVEPHRDSSGHICFCPLAKSHRQSYSSVPEVVVRPSTSPCESPIPHKITKLLTVSHRPVFTHHRLGFICLAAVGVVLREEEMKMFRYLEVLSQGHVNNASWVSETELAGM